MQLLLRYGDISRLGTIALACLLALPASAQVLVDMGSSVRYRANSSDPGDQGLEWTSPGYTATDWKSGYFGIGYELVIEADDPESGRLLTSFVPFGTSSAYARATFHVEDPGTISSLSLALDYDDGVIAWINGVEVYRSPEMPGGPPVWNTHPLAHESSNGIDPDFSDSHDISAVAVPELVAGENILAIGVWNETDLSSDLVLVPRLWANDPSAFVVRGPYLQRLSHDRVTIRWATDSNTKTQVRYGLAPGQLNESVTINGARSDHEIELTGLAPDTVYYYSVGTNTEVLVGDDSEHRFRTAPIPGTRTPIHIWAVGDTGSPNAESAAVRDGFLGLNGERDVDLWLMLGDNAYDFGTQADYEGALFNRYPRLLRRTALWPSIGNHDVESASASTETGVYYDIFTLPSAAEAGGVSSGAEAYYSFDYGNVHIIVLNSEDSSRLPAGPMLTWMQADLASTSQDWIVAFWHHPPYSKGSHDSDDAVDDFELVEMREFAVSILEAWGVDLVLAGHSHVYERSVMLDGHYGFSNTLTPEMILDGGDGRIGGDGAYQKAGQGPSPHEGAVYVVAGNGSEVFDTVEGEHPVMLTSQVVIGSVVIDVDGDRLDLTAIGEDGMALDAFSIVKNTASPPVADFSGAPLSGPAPITVSFQDASSTNTASWEWDFDADGVTDATSRNPQAVFQDPGLHEVRLTASNATASDQEARPDYVCVSAIPGAVSGLTFVDFATLAWQAVPGASRYDVIQGDLAVVLAGGDFLGSVQSCLAAGVSGLEAPAAPAPPGGGVHYYLARAVDCADQRGSYDSAGAGQVAPRDATLTPQLCP